MHFIFVMTLFASIYAWWFAYKPGHYFLLQLCFDLLESWLLEHPDAAAFKWDDVSIFKEIALFQDYYGMPSFKNVRFQIVLLHNQMKLRPGKKEKKKKKKPEMANGYFLHLKLINQIGHIS